MPKYKVEMTVDVAFGVELEIEAKSPKAAREEAIRRHDFGEFPLKEADACKSEAREDDIDVTLIK